MEEIKVTNEEREFLLRATDRRDGKSFELEDQGGFVLRDNGDHVIADVYKGGRIIGTRRFTNEELKGAKWTDRWKD